MRDMETIGRWLWRLGPGNPMVVRIVASGSRQRRHLAARMGYLGLLVGLVVVGLLLGPGLGSSVDLSDLAKAGSQVFRIVAYGQVIGVCLLAPLFMAGAIASEQSGKTYDILLTTPLSNLQVVLGSLVGRLFFVLALLLSGLPLFAVVLVFGGVRAGSVLTAFGVAACTAVLVGSVAVGLSVVRAGGRKAVYLFVIGVAAYLVLVYGIDRWLLRVVDPRPTTTWLTVFHPLLVLESSLLSSDYRPPTVGELTAGGDAELGWWGWARAYPLRGFAAWTLGLSGLLVLGAAAGLRRIGQGESVWLGKVARALRLGRGERTRAAREVAGNPIAWREAKTRGRFFSGIVGRWGFAVVGWSAAGLLVWGYHSGRLPALPDTSQARAAASAGLGVHGGPMLPAHEVFWRGLSLLVMLEVAVVCLVAIYMSAGCVSREREDGTLDILLTTPISPRQYVWGKLRGLVRFVGWLLAVPVVTLLGAGGYVWVGRAQGWPTATFTHYVPVTAGPGSAGVVGGGGGGGSVPGLPVLLPEAGLWLAVMLVPFVALCVAAGMSWSLRSRGVVGAVVPTLGIMGAVVLVLGLCGVSTFGQTPVVGPIVNALSPLTGVLMLIDPWDRVSGFAEATGFGRGSLAFAALAAAGGYGALVWAMIGSMVGNFDRTVRELSGG